MHNIFFIQTKAKPEAIYDIPWNIKIQGKNISFSYHNMNPDIQENKINANWSI